MSTLDLSDELASMFYENSILLSCPNCVLPLIGNFTKLFSENPHDNKIIGITCPDCGTEFYMSYGKLQEILHLQMEEDEMELDPLSVQFYIVMITPPR